MAAKASQTKLRPTSAKKWIIGEQEFIQDPLTFFEKTEFMGLVAGAIDRALMLGLDIESLLQLLALDKETIDGIRSGEVDFTKLPSVTSMASIFTRLLSMVPDLLEDAYLLILSVPRVDWNDTREALRQIDDEAGFGILEAFFEQNGRTIADFLPRWRAQIVKAVGTVETPAVVPVS